MRVEPTLPVARIQSAAPVEAARAEGRARFRVEEERKGPVRAAAPRSVATLDTMAAIIALQEAPDEDDPRRRRQRAGRGRDMLDALDRLKIALLSGRVSPAALGRLKALLAQAAGPTGDAELDALVAQIELRAAVEIAKLQAAGIAV